MISAIFSCMNRRENLESSLLSWVGRHPLVDDIVVVDWSSSPPLTEHPCFIRLSEKGLIKIVRVEGEKYYSVARSCNLAFRHTNPKNKILLKLDCDLVLKNESWLDRVVIGEDGSLERYCITGHHFFSKSLTGLALFNKEHFVWYNENIEDYGYEDMDMYRRMVSRNGIVEIIFFNVQDYIHHIPHSDEKRSIHYKNKDIYATNLRNMRAPPDFKVSEYETLSETPGVVTVKRVAD
jgi:hypothetical protein